MPKTKKTKRVSSLRAKYKQTGGSLVMAWVLMKQRKRRSQKQKKSKQKHLKKTGPSVPQLFIGHTGQKNWIGVMTCNCP